MQNYKIECKYIYVSFSTACICVIKSKGDPRIPLFHQRNDESGECHLIPGQVPHDFLTLGGVLHEPLHLFLSKTLLFQLP